MWKPSVTPSDVIRHSQGPWEDAKYVKVVDGIYYYPDSYPDGRHISDLKGNAGKNRSAVNAESDKIMKKNSPSKKEEPKKEEQKTESKKEEKKEETKKTEEEKKDSESKEEEKKDEKDEKKKGGGSSKKKSDEEKDKKKKSKKGSKSSGKSGSKESDSKGKSSAGHQLYEQIVKEMETKRKAKEKERRRRQNVIDRKAYLNHTELIWTPTVSSDDVWLMHYQVKGAKHGKRRYQYEDGSLTPLGRSHYGIGPARKKGESLITKAANVVRGARIERANKKKAKAQQQRLEKARQARKTKAAERKQAEENAKREAERKEMDAKEVERIINSGSPEEVARVKGRATNDQLQYALTRFEKEAAIDSAINKRRQKTGYEKFLEYSDKVGKIATASSNFINLYNNGAKVYNAFYGDKNNKKLPSI